MFVLDFCKSDRKEHLFSHAQLLKFNLPGNSLLLMAERRSFSLPGFVL